MIRPRQTQSRTRHAPFRARRDGMILPMVLVALFVVMAFGAALANAFLAKRQLTRLGEQQQQAFWLAESALHRASHQLSSDANYEGETWQFSQDELDGQHDGTAVIRVVAVTDSATGHRIIVDVSYPIDSLKKFVEHRELFVAQSIESPR